MDKKSLPTKMAYTLSGAKVIKNFIGLAFGSTRPISEAGQIAKEFSDSSKNRNEYVITRSKKEKAQYEYSFKVARGICWLSAVCFVATCGIALGVIPRMLAEQEFGTVLLSFLSLIASSFFSMAVLYRYSVYAYSSAVGYKGMKPTMEGYKEYSSNNFISSLLPSSINY
jgi:hypothetical protein